MTNKEEQQEQFSAEVRRAEAKVLAADEDIRSEEILDSDIKLLERAGSRYAGFARGVQGEQRWAKEPIAAPMFDDCRICGPAGYHVCELSQ